MRLEININGVFLDDTEKGINFWNGLSKKEKEKQLKTYENKLYALLLEQADNNQTFNLKVAVEDITNG